MKPKPRNMETSQPEAKVPSTPRKYKQICANKFKFDPPPEAPVFSPTLEEFENPLKYINKIRPIGQKTGICKIIPPAGWKVPFVLDMDSLKFTPRIQRINELEARTRIKLNFIDQLTKFFALKGKTFQIPVIEKRTLDLYTLHKLVKEGGGHEEVAKAKKWGEIAQKMELTNVKSPALLKTHYDHLILPFITSRLEAEKNKEMGDNETLRDSNGNPIENSDSISPSFRELKSLTFLGPGPKMAVCDLAFTKSVKTRTRGKKIMYEFDPLAKYMCKSCSNGDIEESLVTCLSCEDRYHSSCLIPPLTDTNLSGWRCPKCVATEACKSLEEFGFAQAEREYSLTEFREMADAFKENYFKMKPNDVPTSRVESEFWKVVSSIEESVTVEYGADLHVIDHGSGFPIKNKPTKAEVDNEVFNRYAESGWNLNNLPVLKASVLRHISADISGMKIPWMYAGMCFATFCWHNEDHWSYSINYLHLGEPKTWYGVPGSSAEDFERAMKAEAPELFDSQPDILHQLVTIMNPNDIMKTGVPIYRTDQREGEFVITFPRAYHAGFNQGFNFAEACNFAPYDWLHIGRECISHYSSLKRFCVFSHDELVCKMAEIYDELDKKILLATYKDMRTMVNAEHTKRKFLLMQGIKNASRVRFDELPDDERQCFVCKTTCFLSALVCKCNPLKLVCLDHYKQLCVCSVSNYKLKYHYKIDELVAILYLMRNKVENFDKWIVSVDKSFSDLNKKFYFRIFTELLIDSKDKEFTKDELLNVLEDQVKSCLQISSTAKTYLMNINGDSSKNQKRKHVDDLIEFSNNLNKVPCNLVESNSIKNLLECSLKLKKIAKKLLNSKVMNRARIDHCIRLMKAVNIDFEELSELEIKLLTCDWMDRYYKVISQPCHIEEIEDLIEKASTFPRKSLAYKQSLDLSKSLASVVSWKYRLDMALSTPYHTPQDLRNLWSEQSDMLQVIFPEKDRLAKVIEQSDHIELQIKSLLSGEMVLYHEEIIKLVAEAKLLPVCFPSLQLLQESVIEASRWLSTAKKLYLKRSSPFDLMNALWPRKFVNRNNYYKRTNGVPYNFVESIFDVSGKKFSKRDYRQCYKTQIKSIFELRLQNTNVTVGKSCPCGSELSSKTLECRICYTVYHSRCFIIEDKSSYPTLYNYFNKLICSFCFRTKRPHIDRVRELSNDLNKLAVKVPECYALEYSLSKFNDWQKRAQRILSTKEVVTALHLINANSKKILNSNSVQQLKASAPPNSLIDLNIDIVQLINEEIKDFKHISVSNDKLLELRQLMMEGDIMEITSKESSDIWMVLEAAKMRDYFMINPPLFQPSTSKISKNLVKTKLKVVKKPGMKSVRKNPNIKRIMRKTNMPTITNQNYLLKTKILQAESISSMAPSSPGASSVVSETGEDCAAENCLKPTEDSLDWVQCDGKCGQWFHMKCVDLTKQELSEDDEFLCLHCLGEGPYNEEEIQICSLDNNRVNFFIQ